MHHRIYRQAVFTLSKRLRGIRALFTKWRPTEQPRRTGRRKTLQFWILELDCVLRLMYVLWLRYVIWRIAITCDVNEILRLWETEGSIGGAKKKEVRAMLPFCLLWHLFCTRQERLYGEIECENQSPKNNRTELVLIIVFSVNEEIGYRDPNIHTRGWEMQGI